MNGADWDAQSLGVELKRILEKLLDSMTTLKRVIASATQTSSTWRSVLAVWKPPPRQLNQQGTRWLVAGVADTLLNLSFNLFQLDGTRILATVAARRLVQMRARCCPVDLGCAKSSAPGLVLGKPRCPADSIFI